jgi:hypothetical protein
LGAAEAEIATIAMKLIATRKNLFIQAPLSG